MTLLVDLSPMIQKSYHMKKFTKQESNYSIDSEYSLSGSGIDIVRLMRIFGEESFITGFLGGLSGEYFSNKLENYNLVNKFYRIKDESKLNVRIFSPDGITDLCDREPRVTRDELEGFLDLYMEMVTEEDRIIITGEIPNSVDENTIYNLIIINTDLEKESLLDVTSKKFFLGMEARPRVIFIDKDLLGEFTKLIFASDNEILKVGKGIQERYSEKLIVNLGSKGYMFIENKMCYIVESKLRIDMDGLDNRGLIAGIALGISKNYDMDMILRLGLAFNMAYSLDRQISGIDMAVIKKYMKEVEIIPINN